jgi:DNA modification methylase
MKFEYKFSMPNHLTFEMIPVRKLLSELLPLNDKIIIDPFSNRKHKFASITNDIDKSKQTHYNMCALQFLKLFESGSVDVVLFDPPYSLRQLKEVYSGIGQSLSHSHTTTFFRDIKDEIKRVVKPGGLVYSFGWSSVGMGNNRNFSKSEILLLNHGGYHNDTIILKERKNQDLKKWSEKI